MIVRFVLVGIEGSVNLGLIARSCMNFSVDELYVVSPAADFAEACRYSAGACSYLERAVVVGDLRSAIEGSELVAATSAIGYSAGDVVRQAIPLERFTELLSRVGGRVSILFGRESTGLTREEILMADLLVTIPASPQYPILNVSQAATVFAWELWKLRGLGASNVPPAAGRDRLSSLLDLVRAASSELFRAGDKVERLMVVWRRVLYRSYPSEYEYRLIEYWFRRLLNKLARAGKSSQ